MCYCALAAPCALWYQYHARGKYCCAAVDWCCLEFLVMALDDVDVLCCCVDLPLRYQLFDPDWWCPWCAEELTTASAVPGATAPPSDVPVALTM